MALLCCKMDNMTHDFLVYRLLWGGGQRIVNVDVRPCPMGIGARIYTEYVISICSKQLYNSREVFFFFANNQKVVYNSITVVWWLKTGNPIFLHLSIMVKSSWNWNHQNLLTKSRLWNNLLYSRWMCWILDFTVMC